uniref:ribosomal protein L4 n=1 Tax=Sargassum siliquastrum TaxID=127572 RepID=UPI00207A4812|nr:ribosomal protein L4 [Sargassum siliquastrum]YP_010485432.1 50S ribosomal protein L4 [Sargassum macrocarpum]YP_010485571.1 50S ribosomal protein L4 [Sargassum serratifolium]URP31009.1 ribosomal protein L4 [Sargassum siliquastrum]UVW81365.1 50S ribosomal protein L4 [Sargassum macrocarpum]UVW81504.1 50S ribosomal protein L4 [Sargassum serratifolium]
MVSKKILTFTIKSLKGDTDKITLSLKVKELNDTNNYVIQRAYLTQRLNERQGTANTLTRAEVRGGGRKPWRQKGMGRARAGSNTSPLWKGGGVSFGPKPKLYLNKINRKEWRLGLRNLLVAKEKNITVIENISITEYKTKNIIKMLENFSINLAKDTLIILPTIQKELLQSTSNIKTIKLTLANNLNLKQILLAKNLLVIKDSLKIIEDTYNG